MRATAIRSYSLLLSGLGLCNIIPAAAAPVQAPEPAIHAGLPPPAVDVPTFSDTPVWRTFTSAEGGFSILLPSSPTTEARTESASKEILHLFHCRVKHESYVVEYADKDPRSIQILGPEKMLSIFENAAIKAAHGSVISSRHVTVGKYPGREVVTKRLSGNIETQRTYLVATRFYILTTTHSPTQTSILPVNSDKFLDSFTLLPAKLPDRK